MKNTFNLSGGDLGLDDDKRLQTIINKLKKTADEAHIKEKLEKDLKKSIAPKRITLNDAKVTLEFPDGTKKKLIVVKKSLFCLDSTNKLRLSLLWLVEWK